jgi:Ubiquitin family
MASEPSSSASQPPAPAPPTESDKDQQPTLNLQVLSPSLQHVNRPLVFLGLPAATTIRQLKDKIRQTLPLRPSPETQRLIYRGHPLQRDQDTLLDVFGAETVSEHLQSSPPGTSSLVTNLAFLDSYEIATSKRFIS